MTNPFSLVALCGIFLFLLTQCNTCLRRVVLVGMRDNKILLLLLLLLLLLIIIIIIINGATRRHLGKQMNKETKLRIHNITAKAALKFWSESWVLKKREEQRLEAAQIRFLRHLLGITKLDKEKNQYIRAKKKTGAQNIVKEIKQYQEKWLQHVQRMDTHRLPKQALQYKPKGRRNTGRPRNRWRDQLHFEDQGKRNMPKLSGTWIIIIIIIYLTANGPSTGGSGYYACT